MNDSLLLYHGSYEIVEHPRFGKGKSDNDYGRGFYCTHDKDMAKEWACSRGQDGFCNCYSLDMTGLRILDFEDVPALSWFAVLIANRQLTHVNDLSRENMKYILDNFMIDIEGYDIIRGWRADDRYFSAIRRFLNNTMGLRSFEKAMRLGKLGEQIVLKSERAFGRILFTDSEEAVSKLYYPRYINRMTEVDAQLRIIVEAMSIKDDILASDIVRQEMKRDDPRLL